MSPPRIAAALAVAWLAAVATGCSHDASEAEATAPATPIAVNVVPAAIAQVERSVSLVGAFYANEEVAIAAQIEARVGAFGPDMGDHVQAGDVLVRLDDADLQATLREMQARLAKAHADNARAQLLRTQGIMSAEEAEKMRTEALVLEAQLDVIKVKIERTVIRAPFTGVIAARGTSVGAVVKIGETLYKLVQDDPLKFRTPVPERFAGYLQLGQKIRVAVDAYPGRVFAGEITRINPTSEIANRSITIEALVPNTERMLRPDSSRRATWSTTPRATRWSCRKRRSRSSPASPSSSSSPAAKRRSASCARGSPSTTGARSPTA